MSVASSVMVTVAHPREEGGRAVSVARGRRGARSPAWLHGKNLVVVERRAQEWKRGAAMAVQIASANVAIRTKKLWASPTEADG
jgi:hypothetical protein